MKISHMNMLLFGLSLRFSYSHLLFSPTLALPVEGVGVPGIMLLELSPNKLLLIELPELNRFVADPLSDLLKLPPLFGEKGEPEPDLPKFGRGLGECEPCS